MTRKKKSVKLEWEEANEVKKDLIHILSVLDLPHIDITRIFCYKTSGSSSRSYARVWAFPKIFQHALTIGPAYVIEVLSKYYDRLDESEKKRVLIHELLHIPKNFSGALLPHRTKSRHLESTANQLFREYKLAIEGKNQKLEVKSTRLAEATAKRASKKSKLAKLFNF